MNSEHRMAVFHKNDPYNPVSWWWKEIDNQSGLLKGESLFYTVKEDNGKEFVCNLYYPFLLDEFM